MEFLNIRKRAASSAAFQNIYDKKLPSDNKLLKIRDFAFNYLGLDENQWLEIDLNSKLIVTKYKILDLKEIY